MDPISTTITVVTGVDDIMPGLDDEVVVEVVGQPGANKKELYYLALTVATGLVRQFASFLLPPQSIIMIEYDAASNWVRVTQKFKTSMSGIIGGGIDPRVTADFATAPIFAGPAPAVVGADWNFAGVTVLGRPPSLPFSGKTILNTNVVSPDPDPGIIGVPGPINPVLLNPKPTGDYRSRGSTVRGSVGTGGDLVADLLVPLVYAALTNPSSPDQETFPPATKTTG